MRLLYVEPLGISGGMGEYNDQLAPAYARARHAVDVITTDASDYLSTATRVHQSRWYRVALRRTTPRPLRGVAYALAAISVIRYGLAADAVVYHHMHAPAIDIVVLRILRALGKRLVAVAHDPRPFERAADPRYRRCLRLFDVIVVHGPVARAHVVELGITDDCVVTAPFGPYRPVAPIPRARAAALLGLLEPPGPVAAIIGNLRPGKGILTSLQALRDAPTPVATLLIAGEQQGAWDLDEVLRESVGLPVRIERFPGRMTAEEELAAYSLADVVLALYEFGYSSGVVARAHAVSRRAVLADVGDVALQAWPGDVVVPRQASEGLIRAAIAEATRSVGDPEVTGDATDARWAAHVSAVVEALAARSG